MQRKWKRQRTARRIGIPQSTRRGETGMAGIRHCFWMSKTRNC